MHQCYVDVLLEHLFEKHRHPMLCSVMFYFDSALASLRLFFGRLTFFLFLFLAGLPVLWSLRSLLGEGSIVDEGRGFRWKDSFQW
jgi:hypothetical protein